MVLVLFAVMGAHAEELQEAVVRQVLGGLGLSSSIDDGSHHLFQGVSDFVYLTLGLGAGGPVMLQLLPC